MFAGLIIGTPPSLRIGIETAAAPLLNSPRNTAVLGSCATLRALAVVASGVQLPACAVELSNETNLILNLPAWPLFCSSASFSPFTTDRDCGPPAPCNGMFE